MRDKHEQRVKDYLLDIAEAIDLIESYTKGCSAEDFFRSFKLQDAVERRIGIIGEAASSIPASFRQKYPEVAWAEVAGMRNLLIHEYFGTDHKIVWDVVEKDLPKLKKQIVEILKQTG